MCPSSVRLWHQMNYLWIFYMDFFSNFSCCSSCDTRLDDRFVWTFKTTQYFIILALIDYISKAHKIELYPSSVRSSVTSINFEHIAWIQILVVVCPGPYGRTFFFFFFFFVLKTKIPFFAFWFLFVFVNTGRFQNLLLQIATENCQTNPDFFVNVSHKNTFTIFENWNFSEFLSLLLTWKLNEVKISKSYFYTSQSKVFKPVLNFLPNVPHKTTLPWGFLKV